VNSNFDQNFQIQVDHYRKYLESVKDFSKLAYTN